MNIFVQSRGYLRQQDYQWHLLTVDGEEPVVTGVPSAYQRLGIDRLLYDSRESYVLGRFGEELLLLISGIASLSRVDFMSRVIRDTILYEGTDADESGLRSILAQALQESTWLPALLDGTITFDEKLRFRVDRTVLDCLLEPTRVGENMPNLAPRIRKLSQQTRQELGKELQAERLPQREGFLVVVTAIQSLQQMTNARIWRGLAEGDEFERDWDKRTGSRHRT